MSRAKTESVPAPAPAVPAVPASLSAALLVAQGSVDRVERDAANTFHKYRYTSAEGMLGACRAALGVAGVCVRRSSWRIDAASAFVESTFEVSYPPTGERLVDVVSWPVVLEKGRPLDKAVAGALTTSLSYWLRDLLLLPRQDEDEENMDKRDDRPAARPSQPQRAPSPALRDLNARIGAVASPPLPASSAAKTPAAAAPAATALQPEAPPEELTGFLHAVTVRTAAGRDYRFAEIEPTGTGRRVEYLLSSSFEAPPAALCRVRYSWVSRGDRTPMVVAMSELDSNDDEPAPF